MLKKILLFTFIIFFSFLTDSSNAKNHFNSSKAIDHIYSSLNCGIYTEIFVTNTNNSGAGSLRWAIDQANDNDGESLIKFNLPGNSPYIIQVQTEDLPTLTNDCIIIDGNSQNGEIIIDGSLLNNINDDGIRLNQVFDCSINGLIFRNFPDDGIRCANSSTISIIDCSFISNGQLNEFGEGAYFDLCSGIEILNCTIGGNNINSGNLDDGIDITNSNNINISGCIIAGNSDNGIQFRNSSFGNIGGISSMGNYIYNNEGQGIFLDSCSNFEIEFNNIGWNENHETLGNFDEGIDIEYSSSISIISNNIIGNIDKGIEVNNESSNVQIGSDQVTDANLIANNNEGVLITDNSPEVEIGINSFFCNGLAVSINNNSNNSVQPPTINLASTTQIQGTALPNTSINFYEHGDNQCPVAPCQGKTFIGTTTTNGVGNWSISGTFNQGSEITAIATLSGNSSVFSDCVTIQNSSSEFCDNWLYSLPLDCSVGNLAWSGNTDAGNSTNDDYECATGWTGPEVIADYTTTATKEFFFDLQSSSLTNLLILDDCSPDANCLWQTSSSGNGGYITLTPGSYYFVLESLANGAEFELIMDCENYISINEVLCLEWLINLNNNDLMDYFSSFSIYIDFDEVSQTVMVSNRISNINNEWEVYFFDTEGNEQHHCFYNFNSSPDCDSNWASIFENRTQLWVYEEGMLSPCCTPNEIICSDWIQQEINESIQNGCNFPYTQSIQTADWLGETIVILSASEFPLEAHTNYYDCTGNLIQSCSGFPVITGCTPDPPLIDGNDLNNITSIWGCDDELPDCPNNCPSEPEDILCLDWVQPMLQNLNNNCISQCIYGESGIQLLENSTGEQFIGIVNNLTCAGAYEYNIYDCEGNEILTCFSTYLTPVFDCSNDIANEYTVVNSLWDCSQAIPDCLTDCPDNIDDVSCLPWLQNRITELSDQVNLCGFLCFAFPAVAGHAEVNWYSDNNIIEIIVESCMSGSIEYYNCDGDLLYSCNSFFDNNYNWVNDCAPSFVNNLNNNQTIWNCFENTPDCEGDNSCDLTNNEILCLPWVQDRLNTSPDVDEIATGIYNGEDVILVGHSYCPPGVTCIVAGYVDIYNCEGILLTTMTGIISLPEPNTFGVNEVIYQLGDNLPFCASNDVIRFILNPGIGQAGTTVQVPITVKNFNAIGPFSFTIQLDDPTVGVITGITPAAISPPGNAIDGDTYVIIWDDPSGSSTGVDINDGEVIFYVEVTLSPSATACSEIAFTDMPAPISAYIWENGNLISVDPSTTNSQVCVMPDGGDSCDDPIIINCGQTIGANNEFGANIDSVYNCMDNLLNGKELYFSFNNPSTQDVKITLSGLTNDLELLLLDECNRNSCLQSSDRTGAIDEVIYWENMPSGDYIIVVEGYLGAASSFLIDIECGDIPSGTLICTPNPLECGTTINGNNSNGAANVLQYGGCSNGQTYNSGPENVYTLHNPGPDPIIVVVTMQDHEEDLDLFLLSECDRLDCLKASTNSGIEDESFITTLSVGETNYVVVDGYNGATSSYTLTTNCYPEEDFVDLDCSQSSPISCGETINGNNGNGLYSGSSYCDGNYTNGPENIYSFSNPIEQDIVILLTQLNENLNIYLLDECSVLTGCVGVGNKSETSDEGVIVEALPPGEYYIVIDGYDGAISDYSLSIECTPQEVTKSGNIATEYQMPVQDVEVNCNGMLFEMTDQHGNYSFDPVPAGEDYALQASKDINYRNGVGIEDRVYLRRHILNAARLNSPYKFIAADLNNDGEISIMDMIRLEQMLLFMLDDWPEVDSWRFVPSDFNIIPSTNNAIVPDFEETISHGNLITDAVDQNFIAIKMGDLSENASGNMLTTTNNSDRSTPLLLHYNTHFNENGKEHYISFYSTSDIDMSGFQLELSGFDNVNVSNIESIGLNGNIVFNQPNERGNEVLVLWDEPNGFHFNPSQNNEFELFRIYFDSPLRSSEDLYLTNRFYINKAVSLNLTESNIFLEQLNPNSIQETANSSTFKLYQNKPNPFGTTTTIGVYSPNSEVASLHIYDTNGREIIGKKLELNEGYNAFEFSKKDFPSEGVYFYKITHSRGTATKSMILLK